MRAIVYTSNTGSTEKYAKMLSHQICVPSYSMEEAKTKVKPGAEIIYMGWIMAGKTKDIRKLQENIGFRQSVESVWGRQEHSLLRSESKNKVPQRIPLFTLQGIL